MPNLVNRLIVQELTRDLAAAEGLVLVSFGGLDAVQTRSMRDKLVEQGCRLSMVRNALARRVLAERGWEVGAEVFSGNTAIAHGSAEAVIHAAKVFTSAEARKLGKVALRGGVLDGRLLSAEEVASLADIPGKDTLRARLLSCLSGPQRGLVSVLNGLPSGLARLLEARSKQLAEAPAP